MTLSAITRANNGAAFLSSVPTSAGGNWVQDTATANAAGGANWMDPSASKGGDAVKLAANAFASAHQVHTTILNSIAVNTGISVLAKKLTGKSVNILA